MDQHNLPLGQRGALLPSWGLQGSTQGLQHFAACAQRAKGIYRVGKVRGRTNYCGLQPSCMQTACGEKRTSSLGQFTVCPSSHLKARAMNILRLSLWSQSACIGTYGQPTIFDYTTPPHALAYHSMLQKRFVPDTTCRRYLVGVEHMHVEG